ncbi:MAG: SPOR domain-containing protein [Alteromonadaceae bacterium]|nr:SPOR domain-containing protein [Alteromonadaceae bacterium]
MDGLKQRIIGALVLVCLAVIFVPMIFDEPHSERQSTPITIPEEPPFPEVEMPEEPADAQQPYGLSQPEAGPEVQTSQQPETTSDNTGQGQPKAESEQQGYRLIEDPEQLESSTEGQPAKTANTEEPEEAAPEPTSAEFTRSLEGAWVVQLGSFGKADNARRLRDQVIDMGYDAHLQTTSSGETTFTRVFSGPYVDKQDAESAKQRLDEAFSLNSLVTRGGK